MTIINGWYIYNYVILDLHRTSFKQLCTVYFVWFLLEKIFIFFSQKNYVINIELKQKKKDLKESSIIRTVSLFNIMSTFSSNYLTLLRYIKLFVIALNIVPHIPEMRLKTSKIWKTTACQRKDKRKPIYFFYRIVIKYECIIFF